MQRARPSTRESLPEILVPLWSLKQAVQKGAQVEPCPAGHDRHPAPCRDIGDDSPGRARIIAGCVVLVWIQDFDEVVWDAPALLHRCLGRADVHVPVQLDGVAVDDFTMERLSQRIALGGVGRFALRFIQPRMLR